MMTSDTPLGETLDTSKLNFREKMLATMSPTTAEKIFTFVKEKQETIQTAKTEVELDNLKAGILPVAAAVTATTETTTTDKTTTPDAPTATTTTTETTTTDKKDEATDEDAQAKEDAEKIKDADKKATDSKENIVTGVAV
jgi:hypothetical protein